MMNLFRLLMFLWFTASAVALGFGIFKSIQEGIQSSVLFFLITLIGAMMGEINRRRAKNWNKRESDKMPDSSETNK